MKIFKLKKKNSNWKEPKTGIGLVEQIDVANAFSYDKISEKDMHKALEKMSKQFSQQGAIIYTGPQGAKAFDKAMKSSEYIWTESGS